MASYKKTLPGQTNNNTPIVSRRIVSKSAFMERLAILCRDTSAHPLPVRMAFIGWSKARDGRDMAVYGCPFHGCNHREGWVQSPRSGKPVMLWSGKHKGRR